MIQDDICPQPDHSSEDSEERNPNCPLFNPAEMAAIVKEAKRSRCPVAAHAQVPETVIEAADAGVTSLEHGFFRSDEAIKALKRNGTIFVPTISVIASEVGGDYLTNCLKQVNSAWKEGVKLACGGDTGAFPHGENALELELFVRAGIPLEETLTAATLHGWEACGGDWCGRKFGWLGEGWAADLVAIEGDPRENGISAVKKVLHVLKDGMVMVRDGKIVD